MKGIEFDKDNYRPKGLPDKNSWAIESVMKISGYRISNSSQAGFVLLLICTILIAIAIYNFTLATKKNIPNAAQIQEQTRYMDDKLKSLQENN